MSPLSGKRLSLHTMGCRFNRFESEWMRQAAEEKGWIAVEEGERADCLVVNTCAVTAESERQARQLIRRLVRENPGAKVVVTGCYAERDGAALAAIPGVDEVLGNREKGAIPGLVSGEEPTGVPVSFPTVLLRGFSGQARSYLEMQSGCDEKCTFCVIPSVRGPSRSLPERDLLLQVDALLAAGFQELVATGINLGSYGADFTPPLTLARGVAGVLERMGSARLMLSSLDPADVDGALVELFASRPALMPYLHFSGQSGDDGVLKRMGRRHRRQGMLRVMAELRRARPEMVFGADWIVGFPGEDEEAFEQTCSLVEEGEIALHHVFRYSERPGTAAARFPPAWRVPGQVAAERAERLRTLGEKVAARVASRRVGGVAQVLLEEVADGVGRGRTQHYLPVQMVGVAESLPGRLLTVRLLGWEEGRFLGQVIAD